MAAKVKTEYAVQVKDPATGRWVTRDQRSTLSTAEWYLGKHYSGNGRIVSRTVIYSPWKPVK